MRSWNFIRFSLTRSLIKRGAQFDTCRLLVARQSDSYSQHSGNHSKRYCLGKSTFWKPLNQYIASSLLSSISNSWWWPPQRSWQGLAQIRLHLDFRRPSFTPAGPCDSLLGEKVAKKPSQFKSPVSLFPPCFSWRSMRKMMGKRTRKIVTRV